MATCVRNFDVTIVGTSRSDFRQARTTLFAAMQRVHNQYLILISDYHVQRIFRSVGSSVRIPDAVTGGFQGVSRPGDTEAKYRMQMT